MGVSAYSQRVMIPSTPVTDTVRVNIKKKNEVQEEDGIKMETAKDIIENIRSAPRFTRLFAAIRSAGLIETFKSKGPITLFAPTNTAFKKMPAHKLDSLMKKRHDLQLNSLLAGNAVPGKLSSKDLLKQINKASGKAELTTLGGSKIIATKDQEDHIILLDETGHKSMIIIDDLKQSNGMIHVIDNVLQPKSKLF